MKNRIKELFRDLKIVLLITAFIAVFFDQQVSSALSLLLIYAVIDAIKDLIDENK